MLASNHRSFFSRRHNFLGSPSRSLFETRCDHESTFLPLMLGGDGKSSLKRRNRWSRIIALSRHEKKTQNEKPQKNQMFSRRRLPQSASTSRPQWCPSSSRGSPSSPRRSPLTRWRGWRSTSSTTTPGTRKGGTGKEREEEEAPTKRWERSEKTRARARKASERGGGKTTPGKTPPCASAFSICVRVKQEQRRQHGERETRETVFDFV